MQEDYKPPFENESDGGGDMPPMKEDTLRQEATDRSARTDENESGNETGSDFSRSANASDTGTGYTQSDGTHGYVYVSKKEADRKKNHAARRRKAVVIALAVTVASGLCLLGALAAFKRAHEPDGDRDEPNTSNGLYIDEGKKDHDDKFHGSSSGGKTPGLMPSDEVETADRNAIPHSADIDKKDPERSDNNQDGKPDAETDASGQILTSAGDHVLTRPTVVSRVADSVVEITTETLSQSAWVGQYVTSGAGSGVIISENGFIVTNNHVVEGADTITVTLTDGSRYEAIQIGTDEKTDIAVLWIDARDRDLTVARLGSSFDLVVGEPIIAIGNPMGSLGGTVTEGIISATARNITIGGSDMTLLQVSAPINPGNSGGGLFNMAGELVGIVNAKCSSEEIEGLGFAVPIDTAYTVIDELISHGYVRGRPALGAVIVDITSSRTAMYYYGSPYTGVYVHESEQKGLSKGDLILAVDGEKISTSGDVNRVIGRKKVGDTVNILVYRKEKQVTVTVTLREDVPKDITSAA